MNIIKIHYFNGNSWQTVKREHYYDGIKWHFLGKKKYYDPNFSILDLAQLDSFVLE